MVQINLNRVRYRILKKNHPIKYQTILKLNIHSQNKSLYLLGKREMFEPVGKQPVTPMTRAPLINSKRTKTNPIKFTSTLQMARFGKLQSE